MQIDAIKLKLVVYNLRMAIFLLFSRGKIKEFNSIVIGFVAI